MSGRISEEALSNNLRTPLIDQYIKIYQEEVVNLEEAAEEVTQAMTRLDEMQQE